MKKANSLKVILILITAILSSIPIQASSVNNTKPADETCTVEQVLKEYARLAGKPCITGVPSGHDKNNMFLPFGVMAEMIANKDGSASLTFLESALR